MNGPPGSATPFSHLRCPVRSSAAGSRSLQAPTFILPTASKDQLSQDTWQLGPDAGAVLLGKHFISFAFVQQWFKIGGDGRDTNQMSGIFNFTYLFDNGWTIGTQPTLFGRLGGAGR